MSAPYTVFLIGGIASGKSYAARRIESLGAARIDLDAISRELLAPGMPLLEEIAEAFGDDLIDAETGELKRSLLAERAFASAESVERLEAIEHPAIISRLGDILLECGCSAAVPEACVVEVPLPDKMGDALSLADEIVAVVSPRELRRERAIGRGMRAEDFDARDSLQADEAYLLGIADTVFDNSGGIESLDAQIDAWWDLRFPKERLL